MFEPTTQGGGRRRHAWSLARAGWRRPRIDRSRYHRGGVHPCIMALLTAQCKTEMNELATPRPERPPVFPGGITPLRGSDCGDGRHPPSILLINHGPSRRTARTGRHRPELGTGRGIGPPLARAVEPAAQGGCSRGDGVSCCRGMSTALHPIPWSGKDLRRRLVPIPRTPIFFRKKPGKLSIVSLGGFPKATVARPPLLFDWVDS